MRWAGGGGWGQHERNRLSVFCLFLVYSSQPSILSQTFLFHQSSVVQFSGFYLQKLMGENESVLSPASVHAGRHCGLPEAAGLVAPCAGTSGRSPCLGSVHTIPYPRVHVRNSLIKTKRGLGDHTPGNSSPASILELPLLLKPELHLPPRSAIQRRSGLHGKRRNGEFRRLPNPVFQPRVCFRV